MILTEYFVTGILPFYIAWAVGTLAMSVYLTRKDAR
jgi:hypothetical protein